MMNNEQYYVFLNAADEVCGRCPDASEEACASCPVRRSCDRLSKNRTAVATKCEDCIPEAMSECENCIYGPAVTY